MTHRILILTFALCLAPDARADIDPSAATAQLRERLQSEWQALIAAEKSFGWRIELRGQTFTGDWVIHLDGWRYFFARGKVRCRIQADHYLSCDGAESTVPRWTATPHARRVSVATLHALHRGLFGDALQVRIDRDGHGHAIVETITRTPDAATRTSRRYRAHVILTPETFAIGEPRLVEEYRETCVANHGCHAVHWNCVRARS